MSFVFFGVLSCALIGLLSGFMGNFLVVRRMSLMGDVLGHALLPGICLGFVLAGYEKQAWPLFWGALFSALLAGLVHEIFAGRLKIKADAAMAIVLTGFYGVGTMALAALSRQGGGSQAGLDRYLLGQAAAISPDDLRLVLSVLAVCLLLVVAAYKEIRLTCFDPDFAQVAGLKPRLFSFLISLLVCATVVVSVQAAGVILASALLIVPAATASFLARSLAGRLLVGALCGALAGGLGAYLSATVPNIPTGPSIILCGVTGLVAVLLFSTRHGWVSRGLRRLRTRRRHAEEDLLKLIYHAKERHESAPILCRDLRARWNPDSPSFLATLSRLRQQGAVLLVGPETLSLSQQGLERALQVVRNHRIWELYLVRRLDFSLDHVHEDAEEVEHLLTPEIVQQIEESLGSPLHDPHGRAIPSLKDLKRFGVPGY